jgi:hypothetical protein
MPTPDHTKAPFMVSICPSEFADHMYQNGLKSIRIVEYRGLDFPGGMKTFGGDMANDSGSDGNGLDATDEDEAMRSTHEHSIEDHWVPGNTIRLLGDDCKIMLNPGEGYDFDPATASPPEPPVYPELGQVNKTIKVGMSDDSIKSSVHKIRKTGDRKEKPRRNEAVFLRLTTVEPGYEFADAFGLKVPYKAIRFDPGNDRRKTHIELASQLIRRLQDFEKREIPKYAQAMRDWRKNRRDWELKLVVHEFKERKNMQIFKSGFGDADIAAARQKIARDNAREDSENPFPPTYQGREAPQLIPKKRLDLGTDDLPAISGKAKEALTAGAKRAKKQEKEVSRKRKEKEARGRKKAKLIERAARRKRGISVDSPTPETSDVETSSSNAGGHGSDEA